MAILLVIAYHIHFPGFPGGFVGVDVFFALSGYLITGLLLKELTSTGRIDLVQFYARRARRLLPASGLVLLTTILVGHWLLAPFEQRSVASTARATAAYLSNLWFAGVATDYLAAPPENNPLLHTWSLSVEEQFYLAWPLLMIAATWRARKPQTRLVIAGAGLVAVSFLLSLWLTRTAAPVAFFGPHARAWEFGLGALGVLVPATWWRRSRTLDFALAGAGLLMIVLAATLFGAQTAFPGVAAVLPVLGTVLILSTHSPAAPGPIGTLLNTAPLQFLGNVSYAWYLWHWPALVFAEAVYPSIGLGGRLLCAVGSCGLAVATRSLVENPIRFSRPLVQRPVASLALAFCLTVVTFGASDLWRRAAGDAAEAATQNRFSHARDDIPTISEDGCHVRIEDVHVPACAFGNPSSSTTVVLFGDSHAAQWFPALERIAHEKAWRLITMTKSGCPAADILPFYRYLKRPYTECSEWRRAAMARILDLKPHLVILANASLYLRDEPDGVFASSTGEEWATGLRRTMQSLNGAGLRTVLLRETPLPGFDVPTCLARRAWRSWMTAPGCDFPSASAVRPTIARIDNDTTQGLSHVRVLDLFDAICQQTRCDPTSGDVVIYRDNHHITAQFSSSLAPILGSRLDALTW